MTVASLIETNMIDICIANVWTDIAKYCITNELYEDCLKITMALMESERKSDVNFVHVDFLYKKLKNSAVPLPPWNEDFSLDNGLELYVYFFSSHVPMAQVSFTDHTSSVVVCRVSITFH